MARPSQSFIHTLIFFSSLCLGICTLLVFLEGLNWMLSLFSHFIVQYALISIALLIFAAFAGDIGSIGLNCLTLSVNIFLIFSSLEDVQENSTLPEEVSSSVKILSSNVFTRNEDFVSIKQVIEEVEPDVVVLLEINKQWVDALKGFAETYPYRMSEPREDNFGMMVLSRLKLKESKLRHFDGRIPFLETRIEGRAMELRLVALHTLPPISSEYKGLRDKQMKLLAQEIGRKQDPVVIIGDFNDTPWTSNFKRFLQLSHVKMAGLIFSGTWPARLLPFRIQLDHALVKNLKVSDFRVHRAIGSDHYPISLTVFTDPR